MWGKGKAAASSRPQTKHLSPHGEHGSKQVVDEPTATTKKTVDVPS